MRSLALFLLLPSFAFAESLTSKIRVGPGEVAEVRVSARGLEEVGFVTFHEGKEQKPHEFLGGQLVPIHHKGKKKYLIVADLDGDGAEEFLLRTTQPPLVGSLYTFRWDKKDKRFKYVPNERRDSYIAVPLHTRVDLVEPWALVFKGKEGGKEKEYRYLWKKNRFVRDW